MRAPGPARTLVAVAVMAAAACAAGAQAVETARVRDAADVFRTLLEVPEADLPAMLVRNSFAVAIFPGMKRVGLVVGGQRGSGVLLERGDDGTWSRPVFLAMKGLSIGWQAGVQSSDVVLFFRTRQSVEKALSGSFTLGVDASLAAGSLGRSAAASTDSDLEAEIYSYSRARGIFAGLAVQGARIEVDAAAAAAFYGKKGLDARAITGGAGLSWPAAAAALRELLGSYGRK